MIPFTRKQYERWLDKLQMKDSEAMKKMYADYINEYIEQNAKSDAEKKVYKTFLDRNLDSKTIEDIDNIVLSRISGNDLTSFSRVKILETVIGILVLQHKSRKIVEEILNDLKGSISSGNMQYAMILRDMVLPAYKEAEEYPYPIEEDKETTKEDIEVKALNEESSTNSDAK